MITEVCDLSPQSSIEIYLLAIWLHSSNLSYVNMPNMEIVFVLLLY